MKTIYFIRHAKSSWKDTSLRDIDRPLNKRGFRDAPFMAKMLRGKGVMADAILSSPANRAFTAATYFAKAMDIPKKDIIVKKSIYEAYASTILEEVQQLSDDFQTVLMFGHNPTFTTVANMFTNDYIANVPTTGIVKVEMKADKWKDFSEKTAQVTDFYYPKQYF